MSLVWSNELEANKREQEACSLSFFFVHSSSNVYLYRLYFLFLYFLFVFFSVWFNSDVRLDFATIPRLVSVNLMLSVDFGRPITFLFGSNI